MDDDLVPTELVARVLDRHLRLPASWDDVERREFVDEAAREVAIEWLSWPMIGLIAL